MCSKRRTHNATPRSSRDISAHTIILLHDRDITAEEFAWQFFGRKSSTGQTIADFFPTVNWLFPRAENLYSTRDDSTIPQWFDVQDEEYLYDYVNQRGLNASVQRIQEVIEKEVQIQGDARHIILCGIGQGAAVAVQTLLESNRVLGGVISLCGWCPMIDTFTPSSILPSRTPVLLQHARDDEVVNFSYAEEMQELLNGWSFNVYMRSYGSGGHWIENTRGVDDIARFLHDVVGIPRLR